MRTLTVVFIAALLAGLAARAEAQNGYYYYGPGGNAGHYWNGLPASKGDAYPWEHSQSWNDRHWNERRHWRHDHDDGHHHH